MDTTNAPSPAALAPAERARLAALESVVGRGRVAFLAVGRALTEIRDARLYRADDGTFAAYLARRWGWKRSHGYELIAAAAVVENVRSNGHAPPSLTQAVTLASLPVEQQREIARSLDLAPLSIRELRAVVDRAKAEIKQRRTARPAPPEPPTPAPLPAGVVLGVADATIGLPLGDGSVGLIVGSPPYGVALEYAGVADWTDDWDGKIAAFLAEVVRVLAAGGRLALNVPLDVTRPYPQPRYAPLVEIARHAGLIYRFTIRWDEDNISKGTGFGSVESANAPHWIDRAEYIAVLCKGAWNRDRPGERYSHDEWRELKESPWRFPGESRPWEGHPASFPVELARRVIRFLSLDGDVVCDPFLGSGTSAVAASALGRPFHGFDISPAYVASARRRLAAAQAQKGG